MYRFPVKVEQRGENFVVLIPAVPGFVASGRTRAEALCKAREMLQAILMQAGPGVGPPPRQDDGADGEYVEVAAAVPLLC